MLEFFEIRTWEATLLIFIGFVAWGLLSERAKRKRRRHSRGETQRVAKQLLLRSSIQHTQSPSGQLGGSDNWASANPTVLPLSGAPVDTNDQYVVAALGMESNRQDFYKQAWDASHNNEYTTMKPGSW